MNEIRDIEAIKGKRFSKDEVKAFDVSSLLGINAQLQVVQKEKADGSIRGVRSPSA